MFATDNPGKVVVLSALILLTVSTAGAASIDTRDGSVWLDAVTSEREVVIDCSGGQGNATAASVTFSNTTTGASGTLSTDLDNETGWNVSTRAVSNAVPRPGVYNVSLSCERNVSTGSGYDTVYDNASTVLDVNQVDITVEEPGVGFVDERLRPSETRGLDFLESAVLTVSTTAGSPDEISTGDVSLDTLDITTRGIDFDDSSMIATAGTDDGIEATLSPRIRRYLDDGMVVTYSDGDQTVLETTVDTKIYDWKVQPAGLQPKKSIEYTAIEDGAYTYGLAVTYKGQDPGQSQPLLDDDFHLTVKQRDDPDDEVFDDEVAGGDYEDREWLNAELIDSSDKDYDYRVTLENFNRLNDLGPGKYKFMLQLQTGNSEYTIDSIIVEKGLTFSGRVATSGGSGISSLMTLRKEGLVTKQVTVESDGFYDESITYDEYSSMIVELERGGDAPTSTLTLQSPDLSVDTENGWDSGGSIVYDYWDNPGRVVDIDGVKPVSMMAIGFGYEINGGAQADIRYSSAGVRPNEAQVYECSRWNFGDQACNGDWERVESRVGTRGGTFWWAHVDEMELYTIPDDIAVGGSEKDILRNAYVVGVPATLETRNQLSLNSAELPAGDDLEVTGTITSSTGQTVPDADVTLELLNDGVIERTYETTTDGGGFFELSGPAPDEPGSYRLRISAEKMPYDRLDETSDQRIEVFYETGMALTAPDNPEIRTGETSRLQFTIQNTGQVPVEDISVDVDGIDDRYYRLEGTPSTVPADEPRTVTLVLDLPSDYGSGVTGPTITLDATGQTDDGEVDASAQMLTSFARDESPTNTSDTEPAETDSETGPDDGDEGSFSDGFVTPAGNLIQSQSDVNIALGLILIFALILAVAIKKRDTNGPSRRFGDTDRRGPRKSRIERPKISASNGSNGEPAPTNDGGSGDDGSSEDGESEDDDAGSDEVIETDDGTYMYDGKEFDTKEGVELYREMQE